jgi:hypothetical protein
MSIPPSVGLLAERAIVTALSAPGAPAPVYRGDTKAFTRERYPAFNVFPMKFKNDFQQGAKNTSWVQGDIRVRCYAQASNATPVSEAIDPLIVWAHRQIMADPTLGGLIVDAELSAGEFAYDEQSDPVIAEVELTVDLGFGTLRNDPATSTDYPL